MELHVKKKGPQDVKEVCGLVLVLEMRSSKRNVLKKGKTAPHHQRRSSITSIRRTGHIREKMVILIPPAVEGKLIRGFKGIEVGDRVRVELIGADVERGFIEFVTDESIEHVARHVVRPEEVEEVCFNEDEIPFIKSGRENLHYVFGRTYSGRFLFVVVRFIRQGEVRVIIARDMNQWEKTYFKMKGK